MVLLFLSVYKLCWYCRSDWFSFQKRRKKKPNVERPTATDRVSLWSVVPTTTRHVRPRRSTSDNDAYVHRNTNAMHDAMPLLDRLARPPVCWLLVGSPRFHGAITSSAPRSVRDRPRLAHSLLLFDWESRVVYRVRLL